MEVEDDLDVVFHKGVESEGTSRELPSSENDVIEL